MKRQTSTIVGKEVQEKVKSDIILDALDDGVMVISAEGTIRTFNPAATTITGWTVKEAIGLDYKSVLHLVDNKNVAYPPEKHPVSQVFKTAAGARDNTGFLVSRSGSRIAINMAVSPMSEQNRINGVVVIMRDVSQERGEEQRRIEFIATASHEMRSPVAAIEGYLALALNDKVSKVDNKARDYLEKAHTSTQHLGKLFQDLLTSARAEDGRLTSHPSVVEMGEFLEKLAEDFRFVSDSKGLSLEFVSGEGQTSIDARPGKQKVIRPFYYALGDPDRLREVITNLFDNAVKYTEAGKITVGITGDDEVVQIRVADTGPGIPMEDLPHLFQKFYRVDNSITRTIGGTGLGLFISKKIIDMYNGRIWAESEEGKGSVFYINLPRLTQTRAAQLLNGQVTAPETPPAAKAA